jgi:hypothetical protein
VSAPEAGGSLLQQTGGTINAQALAVGDRARAIVHHATMGLQREGRDEVLESLTRVVEALEAHGKSLPDHEAATGLVERIATETAKPKPDKLSLKSFLGTLAEEVSSVSAIAKTVAGLSTVVLALFT